MTIEQVTSPDQAIEFLETLQLPPKPELTVLEAERLPALPPTYDTGIDQTVTIGSQLAGFAENISAELRPQISNSFLMAQLAANKHVDVSEGKSKAWYQKYIQVLSNIGWLIEGDASSVREIKGTALNVHKEIIPVLVAALGPAAAAASTVLSILNGLAEMDKDNPWITLFERESQRVSANQFQISYASVENGEPRITLVCFELNASHSVTQVLFFKFKNSHANLKHFEMKMSINKNVFHVAEPIVTKRIEDFVIEYIKNIKI